MDGGGHWWIARESRSDVVPGDSDADPPEASPWISFTRQDSGLRLSGFAARPLDAMSDQQLLVLLEEMVRRERR
ncbi:MAG: hypothetical protein L0271_05415 [Gemmatimonadetes bacterium]|nr:hypothetical protein [Gemmatimonadota bacterium]